MTRRRSVRTIALALLVPFAPACRRSPPPRASAASRADAAATSATSASAPPGPSAARDAGPALVELLHATDATVAVSSVVRNATERPENLVDGDLGTAWSSRTGELEGAAIVFRVPADATVDSIRLTAGMTRARDGGDLFTMNPRVAEVAVTREGEPVVTAFRLDPDNRGLQSIPVHRPGGRYRIAVTGVTLGTARAWREVSVSELEVWGAAPAPRAERRAPAVSVGGTEESLPTAPIDLSTVRPLARGCLAWSERERAAACVVGEWGFNLPVGAPGEHRQTRWQLALLGANDENTPLDIAPRGDAAGDFRPENDPPPLAARQAIAARLRAGGAVSLAALRRQIEPGESFQWAPGATLRWTRRQTSRGGENAAPLYTDRLEARFDGASDAGSAPPPLVDRVDAPVASPEICVYPIPGGRYLVVSSYASFGDEGVSGSQSEAWLCDAVARSCE